MTKAYTRYSISTQNQEEKDILIAVLSDWGIEGFEENEALLHASGLKSSVQEVEIDSYLNDFHIIFEKSVVEDQNWNAIWEGSFEPVLVDDFVSVRAVFHAQVSGVEHELLITPKMSFGTGHHATIYLVMQLMRDLNFENKKVLDFGTGTGILAILAEKLGAQKVIAVDYDDWCIVNAGENIILNACKCVVIEQEDIPPAGDFDIVLANINKNIILDHFEKITAITIENGSIILSGLLVTDEADIINFSKKLNLNIIKRAEKDGWIALFLKKTGLIN